MAPPGESSQAIGRPGRRSERAEGQVQQLRRRVSCAPRGLPHPRSSVRCSPSSALARRGARAESGLWPQGGGRGRARLAPLWGRADRARARSPCEVGSGGGRHRESGGVDGVGRDQHRGDVDYETVRHWLGWRLIGSGSTMSPPSCGPRGPGAGADPPRRRADPLYSGYRVQHNGARGPYKGGIPFIPTWRPCRGSIPSRGAARGSCAPAGSCATQRRWAATR